ncbi:tyrosine-type recombinase/integrase [Bradyrhizobium diazoefficiens]|nr:site-specific integrase [Bradyrhizobium diazoefficiens]MBR0852150.1 tyrosine-type recombinase/integrase [Bradyrhizobium diazoefficiens]
MPKKRLTEEGVKRQKPTPKKQVDYFDAGLPGLVLRVSYGGAKTWLAVHYVEKKAKWFKLGRYHSEGANNFPDPESGQEWPRDLTLRGAKDAARKFFGNKEVFLHPRSPSLGASPLKLVAESYLAKHAAEFRSKSELERCLKKYVYPVLGDRAFADIKRSEVVALRSDIADNHGPRMADTVFGIVRGVMRWFEAEGDDDDYVCPIKARKQKAAPKSRRKRILTPEEIKLVWKAAGQLGPYGSLVKLLLLTAQRRDKVVTMRWADIEEDVWTIPSEEREKGNAGKLRLPPLAMAVLESIPKIAECSYVFAGRYGDKPLNSFSQGAEEIRKLLPATMPRWTLHDLRRTARTLMTDLRIDDRIAEQVLGHAIEGVEGVYNLSLYFEQKAEALARLAGYIQQLVEPTPANVVALAARKARGTEAASAQ